MESEDEFPAIGTKTRPKFVKTYSKSKIIHRTNNFDNPSLLKDSNNINIEQSEIKTELEEIVEELTTRKAAILLVNGKIRDKVCRFCLNITSDLTELDEIFELAGNGSLYKITLKEMVATLHPFKVADDPNLPNKICQKCIDRTISSYLFAQQCEQSERALHNCFEDIYEKLNKLDPLVRLSKRGRRKHNPNYNTLYVEHENVIDYAEPLHHLTNTCEINKGEINELECLKCCEILPNLESLMNHMKIHPKSMWFNCRICGQSFPKLYQIRKHLRLGHDFEFKQTENKGYYCECGVKNDNYNEHLEHIEKHKFKNVMEHLIEKKMDRLCAICLDKGFDMATLDQEICLHGGCKELSGNRTLFSVLESTLPENKNKYQELLIPKQATIIKFVKKQRKPEFAFTTPAFVAMDATDLDSYLFVFSDPENINTTEKTYKKSNISEVVVSDKDIEMESKANNNDTNFTGTQLNTEAKSDSKIIISETDNIIDIQKEVSENVNDQELNRADIKHINIIDTNEEINNIETSMDNHNDEEEMIYNANRKTIKENTIPKSDSPINNLTITPIFVFSNPNFIEINNKPKIDKENWIFYKANVIAKEVLGNDIKTTIANCNICWVFKHLDKCNVCNKPNILNKEAPQFFSTTTNNLHNKREKKSKNNIWRCKICFINNKEDRETCQCCGFDNALNNQKIFNFVQVKKKIEADQVNTENLGNGNKPSENDIKPTNFERIVDKMEPSKNDDTKSTDFEIIEDIRAEDKIIRRVQDSITTSHDYEIFTSTPSFNVQVNKDNFQPIHVLNSDPTKISYMDTDTCEENTIINNNILDSDCEPMETEDIEPFKPENVAISPIKSPNDVNTGNTYPITFNIGTGIKGVKRKRPLRNMTRAFHK